MPFSVYSPMLCPVFLPAHVKALVLVFLPDFAKLPKWCRAIYWNKMANLNFPVDFFKTKNLACFLKHYSVHPMKRSMFSFNVSQHV